LISAVSSSFLLSSSFHISVILSRNLFISDGFHTALSISSNIFAISALRSVRKSQIIAVLALLNSLHQPAEHVVLFSN
jgi:hypothetical protein